jgi:acyl-CoA thioester hydrolase
MPTRQKIRYSDCDPQGIVFNGNYARYWDDAATDWFKENGFGGAELGGIDTEVVTARLEMDFRAVARLGDELETSLGVARFGSTSMTVDFVTRRLSDGVVVAEGKAVYVFVDPEDFRTVPVPEVIKEGLGEESSAPR